MASKPLDITLATDEVRIGDTDISVVTIDIENVSGDTTTQVLYLLIPETFVDADHVSQIKFGPATLHPEQLSDAPEGMTKYQLGSARGVAFDKGQTITLDMSHITAVKPGAQTLQLQWGARGGEIHTADVKIDVLDADDVPRIITFKARNSVVTMTGKPPVELSWETSKNADVSLYRMDKQLLPTGGDPSAPTKGNYSDTEYDTAGLYPYRLKATEKGRTISRTIFVRVQAPGWNRIECDQGAPMNILSDGGNKLYGIFNSGNTSAIYPLDPSQGSMGTQNEICTNGKVPAPMQKSPAAFFQNRIFLVGGSQVDASDFSNEIHVYDPKAESWEEEPRHASWSPRMGHAITSYNGKLWVTGGVDENGNTLSDVYYSEDGAAWQKGKDLPKPMCFHALQGFTVKGVDYLWAYAGLNTPFGEPYTSMWYACPAEDWSEMIFYNSTSGKSPDPGFGAPFGAALTTATGDGSQDALHVIATYQPTNASMDSGMYKLKNTSNLKDPANLELNGGYLGDDVVWKTNVQDHKVQPFQLCAKTHQNYIFVQSILSELPSDALTFYVK